MSATIILLEDDELLSDLYRSMLTLNGYQVICAANSRDIVELVRRWQPALVITDLMMPDHEGLEGIFRLHDFSAVPVIAISSNLQWLRLAESLVTRTMLKPFSAEFLLENVQHILHPGDERGL